MINYNDLADPLTRGIPRPGQEDGAGYLVPRNYVLENVEEVNNAAYDNFVGGDNISPQAPQSENATVCPVHGNALDTDGYLKLYHAPSTEDIIVSVNDAAAYDDCLASGEAVAVSVDEIYYEDSSEEVATIPTRSFSDGEYTQLETAGRSDENDHPYTALQDS